VLLIIDLETGALIRKIDTMAGSAANTNGLASPAAGMPTATARWTTCTSATCWATSGSST
jgi:hypothetical protein